MTREGLSRAARTTAAALALVFSIAVSAQSTRTWVRSDGDDANPCTTTAPCRTFSAALSKTGPAGEINCLGPGGFGGVNITRSVTISCPYTEAGVYAGANGITVDAGPADIVYLRGLDISGPGASGHGVSFTGGAALHIEDSVIRGFTGAGSFGIAFQPQRRAFLFVSNTTIANNGSGAAGGGVLVRPSGGGIAGLELRDARLQANPNVGLQLDTTQSAPGAASVLANVDGSQVSASNTGISVLAPEGSAPAQLMVGGSVLTLNGSGLIVDGQAAAVRVSRSAITNNSAGIVARNQAVIGTYVDNQVNGNLVDGAFGQPISPK